MREGAVWPAPGDGVPARLEGTRGARDGATPRHEGRPPDRADRAASTAELARIAADWCPDAAAEAPDWFLGAWADILTADDAPLLTAVLANHAITDRGGATSAERWARDSAPVAARAAVRAVGRAPLGLWRVAARDGEHVVVEDLVGLGEGWAPDQPARMGDGGGVLGRSDCVLGRAVSTTAGWVLATPLALPSLPPAAVIDRWISNILDCAPRDTLETALARHGAWLSRAAHAHAWESA